MSDYISRDAITEWRPKNIEIFNSRAYIDLEELLALVDGIPAADVEPVRRGRWVNKKGGFFEFAACSLCGEVAPTAGITPNYCPSCGAKMDLEDETNDD